MEKTKGGNFAYVHLRDFFFLAKSAALLIAAKFRALKRNLGNSEINTAETLSSSISLTMCTVKQLLLLLRFDSFISSCGMLGFFNLLNQNFCPSSEV